MENPPVMDDFLRHKSPFIEICPLKPPFIVYFPPYFPRDFVQVVLASPAAQSRAAGDTCTSGQTINDLRMVSVKNAMGILTLFCTYADTEI